MDGKLAAAAILENLKAKVKAYGKTITLAFIQVGHNPASDVYIAQKQKVAQQIGIKSCVYGVDANVSKEALLKDIQFLNQDRSIHGILVQAPLPSHLLSQEIFNGIDPSKDVDGFHALNLGKLCQDDSTGFVACTPLGIQALLKHYQINTEGKHIVILGRSLIVGRPASLLFLQKKAFANATVTVCHTLTKDLVKISSAADILIAALGSPGFVTEDMVKAGAVVIDVGINRLMAPSRKLVGDVDFESVHKKASFVSPVPGGVGPLTVAMLMHNTIKACLEQNNVNSFS